MKTTSTRQGTPEGIIPPVLTPLTADQRMDEAAFRQLLDQLIDAGVHGLFVAGTCGFGSLLTAEDYHHLARTTVEHVNGRLPIWVGVLESSTCRVVERLRMIEQLDISSVVVVLPYYLKVTTDRQILRHFETIRNATAFNLTLYNMPGCVGSNIPLPLVIQMRKDGWISACKDSSGDPDYFRALCEKGADVGLRIHQGLRPNFAELADLGAAGCVPVPANLRPRPFVQAWERRKDPTQLPKFQRQCDLAWNELVVGSDYFSEGLKHLAQESLGSGRLPDPFGD